MGQMTGMRSGLALTGMTLAVLFAAPSATAQQVDIRDNFFSPQTIEIEAGETVTWVHQGGNVHTTTSDSGQTESWDSGSMSNGDEFEYTFNEPGTFTYHCMPHQFQGMVGSVVVSAVTHTVSTSVSGPGSISPTSAQIEAGETAEFTLVPDSGASIDSAFGCGGSLEGDTYTTGPITEACTVSASFSHDTYTVNTSVTGPGSIDPESAVVEHGQSTEFTLIPDTGAGIDSASGCGGSLVGDTYTTGPITADCTVSADFVVDKNLIFWDRFEAGQPFGLPIH